MDILPDEPPLEEQVGAVSSAQINRNSLEYTYLVKENLTRWANELSKLYDKNVKPYFIQIDFDGIHDTKTSRLINTVSTRLALPHEQVDGLRKTARTLLTESAEFQQLLKDLE